MESSDQALLLPHKTIIDLAEPVGRDREKEHKGDEHNFREFLERTHRSMASWPEWKRTASIYGERRDVGGPSVEGAREEPRATEENTGDEHDFREFLERTHRSMAAWPEWKRSASIYGERTREEARTSGRNEDGVGALSRTGDNPA